MKGFKFSILWLWLKIFCQMQMSFCSVSCGSPLYRFFCCCRSNSFIIKYNMWKRCQPRKFYLYLNIIMTSFSVHICWSVAIELHILLYRFFPFNYLWEKKKSDYEIFVWIHTMSRNIMIYGPIFDTYLVL